MIYYFSGTGNSEWAARELGKALDEEVTFIPYQNPLEASPKGETIGFVFPVYSWGVPPLVIDFINRLPESFVRDIQRQKKDVWVVMTCGDEVALAPEMIKGTLEGRGIEVKSIWSIILPNDYVLLPGFDVDSREVEKEKLRKAPSRIKEIAEGLKSGYTKLDVVRGSLCWAKTKLVYPLFKRWGVSTGKWHSTESCVSCGLCVRNCPNSNIELDKSGRPEWGTNCCSCVACYHVCPRHAVEYGNITKKKGQYLNPQKELCLRQKLSDD